MHEQIEHKTLQGADEPPKLLGVAWYYGGYVALAVAVHWFILWPLIGVYGVCTALATYFVLLLLSNTRDEPRLKNMWGYARRRVAARIARAERLPVATVDADDEVIATERGLRMALRVDLTSLDSYDAEGQAALCANLARVVRTRMPKQSIQLLIKSVAVDGEAVMRDLRAMLVPEGEMYTAELAEMARRDLAELERRMATRFVGELTGYLIVGPPTLLSDDAVKEVVTLRHATSTIEAEIAGMGLGSERLAGEALRALVAPPVIRGEGATMVRTDRGYAATLALLLPDDETSPGYLAPLISSLSCRFDLAIHVEGLNRRTEARRFKIRRRFETEDEEGNAGAGVAAARSRRQGVVRWGLYLTLWADTPEELREQVLAARETFVVDLGAEVARLRGHQLPGLCATLAHGVDYADRRWRIDTATVGNCFPFLRFNPGTAGGPPIGIAGNQLVRLDLQDPQHRTAIMNVIALSGGGKTVLALILLKWKLYMGGRGTVLERTGDPDKGIPSHYAALCHAAGGDMVYVGGEASEALNLWEDLGQADIIAAHEILLGEPNRPFPKLWRSLVGQGVRAVRVGLGAPLEEDFWRWLLVQAGATVEGAPAWMREGAAARTDKEREILREMAATLEPYVADGEFAHIFNRPSSVDWGGHLLVFNSQATPDHLQPLLIYLVNAAIDARGMRAGEVPPLTVLDEGWKVGEFEAGQKAIRERGKRGRQTAAEILFLTQATRDLKAAGVIDLFENASVTMLLRLVDTTGAVADDMALSFGLTPREKETVHGLKTVRDERLYNGHAQGFLIRQLRGQSRSVRHAVDIPTNQDEGLMFLSDPLHMVWLRERLIEEHGGVLAGIKAMRALLAHSQIDAPDEARQGRAGRREEVGV